MYLRYFFPQPCLFTLIFVLTASSEMSCQLPVGAGYMYSIKKDCKVKRILQKQPKTSFFIHLYYTSEAHINKTIFQYI